MGSETTQAFNMFHERLRERNTRAEAELEEDLVAQRKRGIRDIQLKGSKLDTYLRHLESIYSKVIAQNNSFTRENVLEVYTPEGIVEMIDSAIYSLGSEVDDEKTGRLYLDNYFKLADLAKLTNLRANSPQELGKLVNDVECYEAVSLGFVEVSPEQLGNIAKELESARDFLQKYVNRAWYNRIKDYKQASRQRDALNPDRTLCFDYFLTPLGRAAVIPISREAVVLAESLRFFESDC
jgi:hypothetical protein